MLLIGKREMIVFKTSKNSLEKESNALCVLVPVSGGKDVYLRLQKSWKVILARVLQLASTTIKTKSADVTWI